MMAKAGGVSQFKSLKPKLAKAKAAVLFRHGQRGPALFNRRIPERRVMLTNLFEQLEQAVLACPGIKHAPRFGRDRLLTFIIKD